MVTGFDFRTVQKQYLPITMEDENKKEIKIFLRSPNKRLLDKFYSVMKLPQEEQDFNMVTDLMAQIMSHNRTGYRVTPDMMEDFELDEIMAFFEVYQQFIEGIYHEKN